MEIVLTELDHRDIDRIRWTGSQRHLEYIQQWMDKAATGATQVIGLESNGDVIGFAYLDYELVDDAGTLSALTIREEFRGQGYGTKLIDYAVQLVRKKNLDAIELRVEKDNIKAIKLYQRLGFIVSGESSETWEQLDDNGQVEIYSTKAFIMRKALVNDESF